MWRYYRHAIFAKIRKIMIEKRRESLRDIAVKYLWSFLGTPYKWGGDDPNAMDCSGLIMEILQAVGLIDRKSDYTASALFELFKGYKTDRGSKGCLVFFRGQNEQICHIEMCINDELMIGASGGGRFVKTIEDAVKYNAFVKIRPVKRAGLVGFIDPFLVIN